MKRLFDFACENGHKTERLVDYETTGFKCECGATANRLISAPNFKLEGWSGSYPSEHGKFERKHLDRLKWEQSNNSQP
jgi:hypothetical protein